MRAWIALEGADWEGCWWVRAEPIPVHRTKVEAEAEGLYEVFEVEIPNSWLKDA